MLRLPQFSIAQLLGFTLVMAVDVWAFTFDVCGGFWVTLVSQVLFWTVLRIFAELRLKPALKAGWPTWGVDKVVLVSVMCSLAGAVAFCTVCTVTAFPIAANESGIGGPPTTNYFPYVLCGVSIPLGTLATAVWLWWTWPRKLSK
jgi:hypothetical protein